MSIRILIVEDEPMVAEDISGHLRDLDYTVATICHSAEDAKIFLSENTVDAVIIDITLSGSMTGLDLADHINEEVHIPFVFLTSHADRNTIEKVKERRAGGYIVKPFDENDLFTSLELAISNHLLLHPPAVLLDLDVLNEKLDCALSNREFDVLIAMKDGKSNTELAESLFLSINTVKTHLKNIYEKLGVKNRTEALFRIDSLRT